MSEATLPEPDERIFNEQSKRTQKNVIPQVGDPTSVNDLERQDRIWSEVESDG